MTMKINKLLTPYNYKSGDTSRIKYIVIHYVGATGGAEANCKYYASKYIGASAHYFVGFKGEIWQSVEDKNIAWSVGGSKYANTKGGQYYGICTNNNSLSIEMCVRKKGSLWYFEDATVENTIELTKMLMKKYGIDADHVIMHYHVTGKLCAAPYVNGDTKHTWEDFKKAISEEPKKDGWAEENGRWRFYKDGKAVKDKWIEYGGKWCYLDGNGYAVQDKWVAYNGDWYYFSSDTYMATSRWVTYDGEDYYMTEDGSMATNAYIKSGKPEATLYYYVNEDGVYDESGDIDLSDVFKHPIVK